MATQIKLEFDSNGFREILCGSGVGSLVDSKAREYASRAGEGFIAVTGLIGRYGGSPRHIAVTKTDTFEARKAQAEYNVLGRLL